MPGHLEGNLLGGSLNNCIVTHGERQSRHVMLTKLANLDSRTVVMAPIERSPQERQLYAVVSVESDCRFA